MLMQHVSTYNSHLQAKLKTVNAYRVVARIWDPIWLTVFLLWFFSVHKLTYIYYAVICRVKYVACAKLLVGPCSSAL